MDTNLDEKALPEQEPEAGQEDDKAAKKAKTKRILSNVLNVLFYVFIFVCLTALVFSIFTKRNDNAMTIFGHQMRFVLTASMETGEGVDISGFEIGEIKQNSVVFVETIPEDPAEAEKWYSELKVGDVLTFRYVYTSQETITHRIVDIREKETGGYIIALEGDNKSEENQVMTQVIDTSLKESPNYVIGKVVGVSYPLGWLLALMRSEIGLIFVVIIPAVIIIIFEVMRITSLLAADRKKKAAVEQAQTQSEIEELKRQLAALQNQNPAATPTAPVIDPNAEQPAQENHQEGEQ